MNIIAVVVCTATVHYYNEIVECSGIVDIICTLLKG